MIGQMKTYNLDLTKDHFRGGSQLMLIILAVGPARTQVAGMRTAGVIV